MHINRLDSMLTLSQGGSPVKTSPVFPAPDTINSGN